MSASQEDLVLFHDTFRFEEGKNRDFTVRLNRRTLQLQTDEPAAYPGWTQLSFHQYPNCPLAADAQPRCPIATNLVELTNAFDPSNSYDKVEVLLTTENRHYILRRGDT